MENENQSNKPGFKKGNQLWQLAELGKKKIFETPDELLKGAYEYFEWCENNPIVKEDFIRGGENAGKIIYINLERPYLLEGLCIYLNVNTLYITHLEAREKEKLEKDPTNVSARDYTKVISHIRQVIYDKKYNGAAVNIFNHNIIARDLGLVDKKDSTIHAKITPPWMQTNKDSDGSKEESKV